MVQILDGVQAAQKQAEEIGAMINPQGTQKQSGGTYKFFNSEGTAGHQIDFDIAVTISSGGELAGAIDGKAKGGLMVVSADLAAKATTSQFDVSSMVSRVRFSIPVFYPTQKW